MPILTGLSLELVLGEDGEDGVTDFVKADNFSLRNISSLDESSPPSSRASKAIDTLSKKQSSQANNIKF